MPNVVEQPADKHPTRVVNMKRDRGARSRPGSVYIGRPSKWGNPFVIGQDGTREQVIEKYREYLRRTPALLGAINRELSGKELVCFCAPAPCHGDVLAEIANRDLPTLLPEPHTDKANKRPGQLFPDFA